MSLFRRRPRIRVIPQRCRTCGRWRDVVEDSAAALERECNFCVIAAIHRAERNQVDMDVVR